MRTFISAFALAALATAAPAAVPQPKLYAVLFEVAHNERGQLTQFEVNRVIDPASGKTDAVKMDVPQAFLDGARSRSLDAQASGKADHYFTYYILDPNRPTNLFIEKF